MFFKDKKQTFSTESPLLNRNTFQNNAGGLNPWAHVVWSHSRGLFLPGELAGRHHAEDQGCGEVSHTMSHLLCVMDRQRESDNADVGLMFPSLPGCSASTGTFALQLRGGATCWTWPSYKRPAVCHSVSGFLIRLALAVSMQACAPEVFLERFTRCVFFFFCSVVVYSVTVCVSVWVGVCMHTGLPCMHTCLPWWGLHGLPVDRGFHHMEPTCQHSLTDGIKFCAQQDQESLGTMMGTVFMSIPCSADVCCCCLWSR